MASAVALWAVVGGVKNIFASPHFPLAYRKRLWHTWDMESTQITAQSIVDAITAGLRAGGDNTDWDAPEFAEAVRLTGDAGCVWDFSTWRETRSTIENHGMLGGVKLA